MARASRASRHWRPIFPDNSVGARGMNIGIFGASLVSTHQNGAAAYYRGLVRALDDRGHGVTFYEPDACGRQQHRDLADPDWARVVVYAATEEGALQSLEEARRADLIIKAG